MKKLSLEFLLGGLIAPWAVWATVAIFSLEKANAVTDAKYSIILEMLKEIKDDLKLKESKRWKQ